MRIYPKCFFCGSEEPLKYINFEEFVCDKDYKRIMKFLDKIKIRKTRYKNAEAWKGAHKL